jgi:hypothetical protein
MDRLQHHHRPPAHCKRSLRFERLEAKQVFAIVTVDTPIDVTDFSDGLTSLREAIFATNIVPGPDEIVFDFWHGNQETILLTQGELQITDSLKISGPGAELVTIDARGNDPTPAEKNGDGSRVFYVGTHWRTGEISVTIRGLTLTGGDTDLGGAIYATAGGAPLNLAIEISVIKENASSARWASGGGVLFDSRFGGGNIRISDSQFQRNAANGTWAYGGGLAIYSRGAVFIENSSFQDNRATGSWAWGGGAFLEVTGEGVHVIARSSFHDNTVEAGWTNGGGLAIEASQAEVTVVENDIARNLATGNSGRGGGISIEAGTGDTAIGLHGNQIHHNEAATGGGVYFEPDRNSGGRFHLDQESIFENTARSHGGGLYFDGIAAGELLVRDSSVFENRSFNDGAGVFTLGHVEFVNSTISTNNSQHGRGGGLFNIGNLVLQSTTISSNSARTGGGIYQGGFERVSFVSSSIVAGNRAPESPDVMHSTGSMLTLSHSLVGDNSGFSLSEAPVGAPDVDGNLVGGPVHGVIDPLLGPLAHNGGPTLTQVLRPGSPAIDAGDPNFTPPPEFDQRGSYFARVFDGDGIQGARLDLGAVEVQPIPPAAIGDYNLDGLVNSADYIIWRGTLGSVTDLRADGNGNAEIDAGDFGVWKTNFGRSLPWPVATGVEANGLAEDAAEAVPPVRVPAAFRTTTTKPSQISDPLAQPTFRTAAHTAMRLRNSLLLRSSNLRERTQTSTTPSVEARDAAFALFESDATTRAAKLAPGEALPIAVNGQFRRSARGVSQ